MEPYFIIIASILIVLGIVLVIAEVISEEADFLSPVALICFFFGTILWFMSNLYSWLISLEWFVFTTIIIMSIVLILSGFSLLITYKMLKAKRKPPSELEFKGNYGKTIKLISQDKEGYIQFRGELWKARSDQKIKPGQNVKILKKEGLVLVVEPGEFSSEIRESIICPKCGIELPFDSNICNNCKTKIDF